MNEDLEKRLGEMLGVLCPVCGAVMEEVTVVSNTRKFEALKCPYCHYKEEAN